MSLSSDLVSQFVKVTQDTKKTEKENIHYGKVYMIDGDTAWVYMEETGTFSGTPASMTVGCQVGDRVVVDIKNHTSVITGNLSSPAASNGEIGGAITRVENLIADKVSSQQLATQVARIEKLEAEDLTVRQELTAAEATISELQADNIEVEERLTAHEADISYLETKKLDAEVADVTYAKAEDFEATDARVYNLEATYAELEQLAASSIQAITGNIQELATKKLDAESAAVTYANIDFSNIGKAAFERFFATSGLIENVVVGDGVVTGQLVGVTISGDVIEGNTVVAEKLVIKGEDGLYYKLNTDGVTTSSEQTDYNSLNGQVIRAKSVTAEKVDVSDLVAFDATIGGFHITEDAIYSDVKDSEGNTTRGTYMDKDGQINFGDETNFVKYYRDESGNYKLVISAESIMYALNGKQYSIADLGQIGDYVNIGTYDGEPCIELGEGDSDFKLLITNTRIMFKEGTSVPAYFNNQSMHIKKAVIEEELQQGGFMWKARSNGNLGLVWKGVTS